MGDGANEKAPGQVGDTPSLGKGWIVYVTSVELVRQRQVSRLDWDRLWEEARGGFPLRWGPGRKRSGRIFKAVELCYFGAPPHPHPL